MHYTYILESSTEPGERYIGHTSDLKKRLEEHNAGKCKNLGDSNSTSPLKRWNRPKALNAISNLVPDTPLPTNIFGLDRAHNTPSISRKTPLILSDLPFLSYNFVA
jgi:hypothetical protein